MASLTSTAFAGYVGKSVSFAVAFASSLLSSPLYSRGMRSGDSADADFLCSVFSPSIKEN
jgi:hypothetical protein